MSGQRKQADNTRLLTLCALLSALGVVLLYVGSLFEVLDLSMAVLASLAVVILVIERGGIYPWLIYGVTALLSFLLLPNKFGAVVYTFFMGFYPIVKEKIEKLPLRPLRLFLKLVIFNAAMVFAWWLGGLLLGGFEAETYLAVLLLILNVTFLFYDYALTVMITAYLRVWRKKLRIDRFFKDRY